MRKLPSLPSLPYPQLLGLLLASACVAVGVQWALRLNALRADSAPAPFSAGPTPAQRATTAGELFGAAPPTAGPAAPQYRLLGVIGGGAHAGAALIGRGDAPAQAYAIGAQIEPGLRLVETAFGSAVLQRDGVRTTLHTRRADNPGTARHAPPGPDAEGAPQARPQGESAAAEAARLRELAGH